MRPWGHPRTGREPSRGEAAGRSVPCGPGLSGAALRLCALLATAALAAVAPAAERPETSGDAAPEARPSLYSLQRQRLDELPGISDPRVRKLWSEGLRLEAEHQLLGSARVYERISQRLPADPNAYWRVSRNYWRYGDDQTTKSTRIKYFTLADEWAGEALAIDPTCGPCYLQKFLAMASLATTRGIFTAIRDAGTMQQLLDRGIELQPTQADNEWNSTLGNLYAAASHFYRVTPEWFWLKPVVGVRGDRERALDYARRAHAMVPQRIDYTVTLGAALLCLGTEKDESRLMTEGVTTLRRASALPRLRAGEDARYVRQAEALVAHPETACRYSPDGQVDVQGALAEGGKTAGP